MTRTELEKKLESQEFYELMQQYRFIPFTLPLELTGAFEAVKTFLLDGNVDGL